MNCIVPFEKDIKFKTNIAEIVSVSLEHEITINDYTLLGNFLISGDYKAHEVSVNTEKFNFTIPFDMALPENIDNNSINFDIEDFTYEVNAPDILKIKIDFSVMGNEIEKEQPIIDEKEQLPPKIDEPENKENREEKEDNIILENKASILNMTDESDEEYVSYHIHIVKQDESIQEIIKLYNVSESDLEEYNDLNKINVNDKLIIPYNE